MQNRIRKITISFFMAIFFFTGTSTVALAANINDGDALKGVKSGKALYDINLTDAKKLTLYLDVIKMSHEGLKAQGVTPDFVVAFRGFSVKMVQKNSSYADKGQGKLIEQIAEKVETLHDMGVRFEACAVATNLFQVDNDNLLPGVKVVANTFNSLIGYQAQGYAIIPIM